MAMQRYDDVVQDSNGNVLPGSSVTVNERDSGNVATIYEDEGSTAIANPMTTDVNGHFWFYAADGDYVLQYADGQTAQVALSRDTQPDTYVVKSVDTPKVNNSTTLVNDTELDFTIGANETWTFELVGKLVGPAGAGIDWDFTTPAATIYTRKVSYLYDDGNTLGAHTNSALTTEDQCSAFLIFATADSFLYITGVIVNGVNAGTVQFRYAQNSATVGDTYVASGSWLVARKLG